MKLDKEEQETNEMDPVEMKAAGMTVKNGMAFNQDGTLATMTKRDV